MRPNEIASVIAKTRTSISTVNFIALLIILCLFLVAVFADVISPYDPYEVNMKEKLQKPNLNHLLGTDQLGRDVLSRIIYGTRISLFVSVFAIAIIMFLGIMFGSIAAYFGGKVDEVIMRFVDVLLSFPGLILAITLVGILGPSLKNLVIAIALTSWASYARIVRSCVLSIKEMEFVTQAKVLGASDVYILVKHVIPNAIAPIIVLATLDMGHIVLSITGLSFLGLGAQPPTPEWGTMLNEGKNFMTTAPWLTIFPGLAIMITVLAFNLLGDGLRDLLDPRVREYASKHY
ncbi:ABC-type dipeptide/oligopeptide/nickel transport systems, permease component [Archaeoglobus sulfaticallidus PM70-1]|uniref:ABC-type dipeptide/oligopeptide/nickel transport systems, permease component n=1 Tax=Archaeoglobus sulfaticallidus PM70-1 TaxID=387631 RepID=N0BF91_9EURY|nr:nickel transporter permease [Archaeoglobus sulfaticallidus]AGK60932.1 ABC-type dipeptide/oligopeptide/nickel transport systems, permease component [Archaeoglobus sulfaticallidus PM70-1]